jgi:hypothetical protein
MRRPARGDFTDSSLARGLDANVESAKVVTLLAGGKGFMTAGWLKTSVQWILVIACAEAVAVPAVAFTYALLPAAVVQVQDERETETVAVAANESRRGVEPPSARRPADRIIRVRHVGGLAQHWRIDVRADLKTRFLSLRC